MLDTESRLLDLAGEARTRVRVRSSGLIGTVIGELPAAGMVTVHHSAWVQTQCPVGEVELVADR